MQSGQYASAGWVGGNEKKYVFILSPSRYFWSRICPSRANIGSPLAAFTSCTSPRDRDGRANVLRRTHKSKSLSGIFAVTCRNVVQVL